MGRPYKFWSRYWFFSPAPRSYFLLVREALYLLRRNNASNTQIKEPIIKALLNQKAFTILDFISRTLAGRLFKSQLCTNWFNGWLVVKVTTRSAINIKKAVSKNQKVGVAHSRIWISTADSNTIKSSGPKNLILAAM